MDIELAAQDTINLDLEQERLRQVGEDRGFVITGPAVLLPDPERPGTYQVWWPIDKAGWGSDPAPVEQYIRQTEAMVLHYLAPEDML